MANPLLQRKVEKLPDRVRLEGRILFLTEDPELIRRQLAGEDLAWDTGNPAANPKLRDDISTDEITPAHICFFFDETLGRFVRIECFRWVFDIISRRSGESENYGICDCRTLYRHEGYGVRRRVSGGLHTPEEGRRCVRQGRDAVYRSGRVHRLRGVRSGLSRFGYFCARRSAGEVEGLHRAQREVLWPVASQQPVPKFWVIGCHWPGFELYSRGEPGTAPLGKSAFRTGRIPVLPS